MDFYLIFAIGALFLFGLWWQAKLIKKDNNSWLRILYFRFSFAQYAPLRVKIPSVLAFSVILGIVGYAILVIADSNRVFSDEAPFIFDTFVKSLVFLAIFATQSYFGPMFSVFFLASGVYSWFVYGDFRVQYIETVPSLADLLNWLFSNAPASIKNIITIYYVVSSLYVFVLSGWDTIRNPYEVFEK